MVLEFRPINKSATTRLPPASNLRVHSIYNRLKQKIDWTPHVSRASFGYNLRYKGTLRTAEDTLGAVCGPSSTARNQRGNLIGARNKQPDCYTRASHPRQSLPQSTPRILQKKSRPASAFLTLTRTLRLSLQSPHHKNKSKSSSTTNSTISNIADC